MTVNSVPARRCSQIARNAQVIDDEGAWVASLGLTMRDVWFLRGTEWRLAPQVDDETTIDECVDMGRARVGARYALYRRGERWVLVGGKRGTKTYPSREAAEMVAFHRA